MPSINQQPEDNLSMKMNEFLISPVQESIVNILSTMADLLPQSEEPMLKSGEFDSGDVTGVIDLVSKQNTGSIAISFTKPVALEIARRMLGLEADVSDAELKDLVGEITNMMAGGAKAKLFEHGYDYEMAIPNVIEDSKKEIRHKVHGPIVVLPFTTDSGKFFVELCFIEI
jgi:chemotaxis protein CheX